MLKLLTVLLLVGVPMSATAGLVGQVRVIDADTWDVGGERVRLFGIDAPEVAQTCKDAKGTRWACGAWATDQVRQRFEDRIVTCERRGPDRYGRTIARCFHDGADVARDMVADGVAFAYRRYSSDYVLDEKAAAIRAVGLHAGAVQSPEDFRARTHKTGYQPPSNGCRVKGNISRKGVRIFHVPGQKYYDRTRISTSKGERWFCSQHQARAAGWRPARW